MKSKLKLKIIVADYYKEITDPLTKSCIKVLEKNNLIGNLSEKNLLETSSKLKILTNTFNKMENKNPTFFLAKQIFKTIPIESKIKLNRINDGKTDPYGNLWFGTMNDTKKKVENGSLYCLDKKLNLINVFNSK